MAIDIAENARGRGSIEDTELSIFTAAALLRGGHGPDRVLDELDRTRRTIELIGEPCPAFEIAVRILHAQTCLVRDDVDGASQHLYPALDQARSNLHRLLTIDSYEAFSTSDIHEFARVWSAWLRWRSLPQAARARTSTTLRGSVIVPSR